MSTTTTPITPTAVATKPPSAPPAIYKQAQTFLDAIPPRKIALARSRTAAKLADDQLFQAKTTLLQAASAVRIAGSDDLQIEEHRAFERQCQAKVDAAHLALQKARLECVKTEAAIFEHDGKSLLEPLRAAVTDHQRVEIERFLSDEFAPASAAYLAALQRGRALSRALLTHGQTLSLDAPNAPAPVQALSKALLQLPDAVRTWQSDPAAKALLEQHQAPRLLLESLEAHTAACKAFFVNRGRKRVQQAMGGSASPVDSAGAYLVKETLRLNGQDIARGTFITLADLGPEGLPLLTKLVSIGKLQLVSDLMAEPATA